MAGAAVRIAILANASQARRELDSTANAATKISDRFSKFRLPATLALGAIGAGAKQAVTATSDLNETISKADQVFGAQSKAIQKFASGAATSLGQSKTQALEAAATFGLIGQKAGLSGTEAAKFSTQFTTLASDLASFNNTTPEEAIEAIGAAMRGESEPIRKYGVLLDDATLRARALKMGLIQTTSQALTPQQKALAASREVLAQTTKAQGDFARTSDGAANKQRIIAAQVENLKASLGQSLLPAYEAILRVLSKFASYAAENQGVVKGLVVGIAALSAVVLAAGAAQKVYNAGLIIYKGTAAAIKVATIAWKNAQFALNIAMALNPIGVVVVAIVALVAIFVVAWKKSETFRKIVTGAWDKIKAATGKVWDWVKNKIRATFNFLKRVFLNFTGPGLIIKHWDKIKAATRKAWDTVRNWVRDRLEAMRDAVAKIGSAVRDKIVAAWNAVRDRTRTAWQAVVDLIRGRIDAFMERVRGIKDRVLGAFSNAARWLYNAGRSIIQGLIDGVTSLIGSFTDKLTGLTDMIPDLKGPPAKDKRLLYRNGQLIMEGLIDGWDSMMPKVRGALSGVTGEIQGFDATLGGGVSVQTARSAYQAAPQASTGGNTYQITVQAPVGASSADIGRSLIKHIDAYERSGGRRRA